MQKRKKKKRANPSGEASSDGENVEEFVMVEVNRGRGEMPEGAQESDGADSDVRGQDDPHRALDINLDE